MRIDVMTLFPGMFTGYLGQSVLKLAIEQELVDVRLHDIRDWSTDAHRSVDDRPFGGGPGMLLKPEPVVACAEAVRAEVAEPGHLVMLTPRGRKFDQTVAEGWSQEKRLLLLCGRYEGFDDRVRQILEPDEVSIGDYILGGGEVAAMVVIDAVARLVPGVLGDEESSRDDSFSSGNRYLEANQYTRPREFRGLSVPEVLLSGNHEAIARWRAEQSERLTRQRRADLLSEPDSKRSNTGESD